MRLRLIFLIFIVLVSAFGSARLLADGSTTREPMLQPKALFCMATGGDGRIYAIGGTSNDGPPVTASVFAYDEDRDIWSDVAPLAAGPRHNLACASDNRGRVYAIGGYDFGNPPVALGRVERYDPKSDEWVRLPGMPTRRQGAAAVRGADGRIYVMGGTDTSWQTLSTMEVFDQETEIWTTASPMATPRTNFAAAAGRDGRIYVYGGYSEQSRGYLNTAEVYDPGQDRWTPISSMNDARFNFAGVACPGGSIYAIGGDSLGTVEVYNPITAVWSYTDSLLLVPRAGHAASLTPDGRMLVSGGDFFGTSEIISCATAAAAPDSRQDPR